VGHDANDCRDRRLQHQPSDRRWPRRAGAVPLVPVEQHVATDRPTPHDRADGSLTSPGGAAADVGGARAGVG
jgi:hypothetical protein